jgi:hypothetical protein
MANPNIVSVTSIYGNTAYLIPSGTGATATWTYNGTTALTGLTPASNTVNRVTSIVVSNVTASAVNCTVGISNNPTYGSGTPYYVAYQISVPANSSLIVTDKTTSFYVTENQSVGVVSATGSALHYVATFEAITTTP